MSDHDERQMVALLGQINEKVGTIREDVAQTRAELTSQGEKLDELKKRAEKENLPHRVAVVERDKAIMARVLWIVGGTALAAAVSTFWNRLTGGGG